MFIKLPRVVIGNDLTGMIVAAKNDATFIPVSYFSPFAWEYTDLQFDFISWNREVLRQMSDEQLKFKEHFYTHRTQEKTITPNTFLWELEEYLFAVLGMNGHIWNDFTIIDCVHNENTIKFNGKYDCLVVEFESLWVMNPYSGIFKSESLEKKETKTSGGTHLLYHIRLNMEGSSDMKGIQTTYDFEDINDDVFTKIWYNKPFGMKHLEFGINPRTRGPTITTKHMVCIAENVPTQEANDEKYEVGSIRRRIHGLFAPKYKRIREKPLLFDKFIKKMTLSSEIDEYEDTENVKFIYYSDKSEIICAAHLDIHSWQDSFLPFLFKNMDLTTNFLLTNYFPRRLLRLT